MPTQNLPTLKLTTRIRSLPEDGTGTTSKSSRPKAQNESARARNKENLDAMEDALEEWMSHANATAHELARRFDKKPRYFLDRFFQGGQKFIHKQAVTNSFNAFKSIKAAQLHAEGESENAIRIQVEYKDEYDALTDAERAQYVADFESMKSSKFHVQRLTSRGCIQDVANVARNMELLLSGLKTRVGIEGFFCIVRNNTEFHISPTWYFTSREISDYMPVAVGKKWSAASVGSKLEAFAIAGCDVINLNRTSQQKAHQMKREISSIISTNLVSITGNSKAVMNYASYEMDIVLKYGIELVGWTHDKFTNPSELSNSLEPLRTLLDALNNHTCKFVKLSPAERRAREAKYQADVASGATIVKYRKTRKDAGMKRKGSAADKDHPSKRIRSADMVGDSDNEVPVASSSSVPIVENNVDSQ